MIMKKRGSLALSMNAIVILIMAIAMLGVGLGVINMVRKTAEQEVTRLGAEVPEPAVASAGNRLTLSGEPVVGARGDTKGVKISYYPLTGTTGDIKLGPTIDCPSGGIGALQVINKSLKANTPVSYIIGVPLEGAAGQYICSLEMEDVSKDIRIIIS